MKATTVAAQYRGGGGGKCQIEARAKRCECLRDERLPHRRPPLAHFRFRHLSIIWNIVVYDRTRNVHHRCRLSMRFISWVNLHACVAPLDHSGFRV